MTTRRQAAAEARRQAGRESRAGSTRPPDLRITCGRCQDGQGRPRFIERFRFQSRSGRWEATAQTREVWLTADGQETADPAGFTGPGSRAVGSEWRLRCPGCGTTVSPTDGQLQGVAWQMVHALTRDGRPPTVLPPLTLDTLRYGLAATHPDLEWPPF